MNARFSKSRLIGWIIILALFGADAWFCRSYWPTLTEPVDVGDTPARTPATRTAIAQATRSPGLVRHSALGVWSLVGRQIEMIAVPSGSNQFAYRYSFTNADDANRQDWRAMLKLQSEINAAARYRGLPPGLSAGQVVRLRSLLPPIAAPLDETTRQKLQAEFSTLAANTVGKKINDPTLLAQERVLLTDLNAAADTLGPALRNHLDEIKRYVGPSQWARLLPPQRGQAPATRPSPAGEISLTTKPIGFALPIHSEGFAWEAYS